MKTYHLNDRHADEPLATFIDIVGDLAVGSLPVNDFMRLPFFNYCLRTAEYQQIPRIGLKQHLLLNSLCFDYQPSDVVLVQEGRSQIEIDLLTPIIRGLELRGQTVSVARAVDAPALRRIALFAPQFWQNQPGREALAAANTRITACARRIQAHFELTDAFLPWFWYQVASGYYRTLGAQRAVESFTQKPRVLVLTSEHHAHAAAFIHAVRERGIPTVLIQHGFLGQAWTHFPVVSEQICVFGEVDRQWYRRRGVPNARLVVSGAHRAFAVDSDLRHRMRAQQHITDSQRAVVFFAPNLTRDYHERAAQFLSCIIKPENRCFVRPHPRQQTSEFQQIYAGFDFISQSVSLQDVFAFADVILHDYSTMCFAEYTGLQTATLNLDAPYPPDYAALLGDQPSLTSVEQLLAYVDKIVPNYPLEVRTTPGIADGGESALNTICSSIIQTMR